MTTKFASLDINDTDTVQTDRASTRGPSPHPATTTLDGAIDARKAGSAGVSHAKRLTIYDYDSLYDISDESDPNIIHAISKLHTQQIQRLGQALERQEKLSELKSRIDNCVSDYLFAKRLADAEFASRKTATDSKDLALRLKNGMRAQVPVETSQSQSGSQSPSQPPSHTTTSLPTPAPGTPQDETGEETMFGNLLDEPPTEETTASGVVIHIKDMSLPKHWSGKSPKILLSDAITKKDRYASASFRVISGGSRAVRCACQVRWAGAKKEEWSMDTVACRDSFQAEQYVATLVLHELAYPMSPGFAGGATASLLASSFRSLPPAFRDLWNELESARKAEEDSVNRSVWANLQAMLRTKLGQNEVCTRY
jgi:ATP-dependent RNA helicase DHX29